MFDNDLLCRAALYPRFQNNGHFHAGALFNLMKVRDDYYALSLGNRQVLRDDEGAHGYGCSAAAAANDRFRQKRGQEPTGADRVHYLGFYDLRYGAMAHLQLDSYWVKIRWAPDEGEGHFQFELWGKPDDKVPGATNGERKAVRKEDRIVVSDAFERAIFGAVRATCAVDADIAEQLNAIPLPTISEGARLGE